MNRRIIMVIASLMIIAAALLGCSKEAPKESPYVAFLNRVETITNENSKLSGYSMNSYVDPESDQDSFGADAIVDGKTIGVIVAKIENEEVSQVIITFASDGPSASEYYQPIIASAMALDSSLNYDSAKNLTSDVEDILIWGGSAVTKNGYTYNAEWYSNGVIAITISKQ